jgi:hypothetical protein
LYTVEDPDKRSLIYFPAFDWNSTDGLMAGVALHNGILIPKPVEYFAIPFYSFRNSGFTGYGRILFNKTPYASFLKLATFSLEGSQFGSPGKRNYQNAKVGLDLYFRSDNATNSLNQKVSGYYIAASDLQQIELSMKAGIRSYLQVGYTLERTGIINPFSIAAAFESGRSFQKVSLELNYKYNYYGLKNGLEIRLFTGTMLKYDSSVPLYAFSASGRGGLEEYLYQGVYPDRFTKFPKTFWSRQMTLSEGGLITPVNDSLGFSRWICSFTMTSSLPGKVSLIPVKPFINIILNDHRLSTAYKSPLFVEAGLKAGFWNFFEVYFPLLVSDNISAVSGSLKNRIRFVFRLDKINPRSFK